jgi:hypothetical protein
MVRGGGTSITDVTPLETTAYTHSMSEETASRIRHIGS